MITFTDLKLPQGLTLVELTKGDDHDQVVITVSAKKVESEESAEDSAEDADNA